MKRNFISIISLICGIFYFVFMIYCLKRYGDYSVVLRMIILFYLPHFIFLILGLLLNVITIIRMEKWLAVATFACYIICAVTFIPAIMYIVPAILFSLASIFFIRKDVIEKEEVAS